MALLENSFKVTAQKNVLGEEGGGGVTSMEDHFYGGHLYRVSLIQGVTSMGITYTAWPFPDYHMLHCDLHLSVNIFSIA